MSNLRFETAENCGAGTIIASVVVTAPWWVPKWLLKQLEVTIVAGRIGPIPSIPDFYASDMGFFPKARTR